MLYRLQLRRFLTEPWGDAPPNRNTRVLANLGRDTFHNSIFCASQNDHQDKGCKRIQAATETGFCCAEVKELGENKVARNKTIANYFPTISDTRTIPHYFKNSCLGVAHETL